MTVAAAIYAIESIEGINTKMPEYQFVLDEDKKYLHLGPLFDNRKLSYRLVKVLFCVVYGKTMAEIAWEFGVSLKSVEASLRKLKEGLDCPTKGRVVYKAHSSGLFEFLSNDYFEQFTSVDEHRKHPFYC